MKKTSLKMTTAQFAKLHHVNRRTLHYYDNISLFSPRFKGENQYRYYDVAQSIDFEYIRMLKSLNMEIEEIKTYLKHPNDLSFIEIADHKIIEIDNQIKQLQQCKALLQDKKQKLLLCRSIHSYDISIKECEEEILQPLPFDFENEEMANFIPLITQEWQPEQYSKGIGSFIHLDKVRQEDFSHYDGIFTYADSLSVSNSILKPKGTYLVGYLKGDWDQLPQLYKKMLDYADQHHLTLINYAYESGLNDFAIASYDDYITQISIQIKT